MFRAVMSVCVGVCAGLVLTAAAWAEDRLALVIGNADYAQTGWALTNPVEDARLIASTLTDAGFAVTLVEDAGAQDMRDAIADFGRALRVAGEDAVGFFYFAGHGVQQAGLNYLIPTDITIEVDVDVYAGVRAGEITRYMEAAGNAVNFVVLDACRDNPLPAAARSAGGKGLASVGRSRGVLYAYSTAPGFTASDGTGRNGPYAAALSAMLRAPGVPAELLFKRVAEKVETATDFVQQPFYESGLRGSEFYFTAPEDGSTDAELERLRREIEELRAGGGPAAPEPLVSEAEIAGASKRFAAVCRDEAGWPVESCGCGVTVLRELLTPEEFVFSNELENFPTTAVRDARAADLGLDPMQFQIKFDGVRVQLRNQCSPGVISNAPAANASGAGVTGSSAAAVSVPGADAALERAAEYGAHAADAWAARGGFGPGVRSDLLEAGDFIFFDDAARDLPDLLAGRIAALVQAVTRRLEANPDLIVKPMGACNLTERGTTSVCGGRGGALYNALKDAGVPRERLRGAGNFGQGQQLPAPAGVDADRLNAYAVVTFIPG